MEKDIHERYCDGKGEMIDDDEEEDSDSDEEDDEDEDVDSDDDEDIDDEDEEDSDINDDINDVEDENRCTASWFDDYACISIYCFKIL